MRMKKLTEQVLRAILHYDPETGIFTRHTGPGARGRDKVGALDPEGYLCIGVSGGRYRAARLAWLWMTGEWPPSGFQIDHINRNRTDDKWSNLRLVTWSEQQFNKGTPKNNKTGHTGVFITPKGRYGASCGRKYLGVFKTIEAALSARNAYIEETLRVKSRRDRDWLLVASPGWPEHASKICNRIGQSP